MTTQAELTQLRQRIAQILLGGACARINFQMGAIVIRSGAYSVIGMSIGIAPAHPHGHGRHRQMGVNVVEMPHFVDARYVARTNEIQVRSATTGGSLTDRVDIVHEATHAVFDYNGIRSTAFEE